MTLTIVLNAHKDTVESNLNKFTDFNSNLEIYPSNGEVSYDNPQNDTVGSNFNKNLVDFSCDIIIREKGSGFLSSLN